MSHVVPCITNVLPRIPSCTWRGEHQLGCDGFRADGKECRGCEPKPATRGEVCDRCYDRIDHAIHVADTLRSRLAGVEHAVTTDGTASVAGPRLPHTAWQLDLDAINRWQQGRVDVTDWVSTEWGAREAVYFAQAVHSADRAHPTIDVERKLKRVRCPVCRRVSATVQPPDWYGDDIKIACIATDCDWEATNPEALDIVAHIEARGPLKEGETVLRLARIRKRFEEQKKAEAQKAAQQAARTGVA